MAKLDKLMKKLQTAILNKGVKVRVNKMQFFSENSGQAMTCYSVMQRKWSDKHGRMTDQTVLKTCSTVEVVKFLAKMLEELENEPDI